MNSIEYYSSEKHDFLLNKCCEFSHELQYSAPRRNEIHQAMLDLFNYECLHKPKIGFIILRNCGEFAVKNTSSCGGGGDAQDKTECSLFYDSRIIIREINDLNVVILDGYKRTIIKWDKFTSNEMFRKYLPSATIRQSQVSTTTRESIGWMKSLQKTLKKVIAINLKLLKSELILLKRTESNFEVYSATLERKIDVLKQYSTKYTGNIECPPPVNYFTTKDMSEFISTVKNFLKEIAFPITLHFSYLYNELLGMKRIIFNYFPLNFESNEENHHNKLKIFEITTYLNCAECDFAFKVPTSVQSKLDSMMKKIKRLEGTKESLKRQLSDFQGQENEIKEKKTKIHKDESIVTCDDVLIKTAKLTNSTSIPTAVDNVNGDELLNSLNYFGSCGNTCCINSCECLGRTLKLRENKTTNSSNKKLLRRRATALTTKKPLLVRLSEFGIVSHSFVNNLGKDNALKFCAFIDIEKLTVSNNINTSDDEEKDDWFAISVTFFDEKVKKMVTLKSKPFSDNSWADQFLEFYNTSLTAAIKAVSARLKKKFEYVLCKLKSLSQLTNNRGFYSQCYRECIKYTKQISIFSFVLETKMLFKLDMFILFLKSTKKSFSRKINYSSDGEIIKIATNDFSLRDLSNFLMERTDALQCMKNNELKVKFLNEISKEISFSNNNVNEIKKQPTGERDDDDDVAAAAAAVTADSASASKEKSVDVADLFFYYNNFICKLFPEFNLIFVEHSSISALSLSISTHESTTFNDSGINRSEYDKYCSLYDIGLFKQSSRTLEIFNNFIYGGLCVRARPFIKMNQPIRPAGANSYLPINTMLFYDVKGMYASVMKDTNLICGPLNHYEIKQVTSDQQTESKNAKLMNKENPDDCQGNSLHLVKDITLFYSEFKSIMYLIWKLKNDLRKDNFISNIYTSYNGNGCFQIDRNQIDLTVVFRRKSNAAVCKILLINIHNVYTHTCDNCSYIIKDDDGSKALNDDLKYKAGSTYQEVFTQSQENDDKIREMSSKIKNCVYEVYYSCCQLSKNIEKWGTINKFFNEFDDVKSYKSHILNPPTRLSIKRVKDILIGEEGDVDDDELSRLINAFYVVKLNTLESQANPESGTASCQFGYIVGKSCFSCAMDDNKDTRGSSKKKCHFTKTTASLNSYSYVMVNGSTLRFLMREKNVEIEHMSHVFTYMTNTSWKKFVNKILFYRQDSINKKSFLLNKSLKLLLNSLIGRLQLRPSLGHNNKTEKLLCFNLPNRFKKRARMNDVVNVSYAGEIFNKTVHYVTFKKLPPTKNSFYFNQGYLINGIKILQSSKELLLNIFHLFEKYFDGAKYTFVLTHTDSVILAASLDDKEEVDNPDRAIFTILKPEYKHLLDTLEKKYFSHSQELSTNFLASFGKLVLQKSIVCNYINDGDHKIDDFTFLAPSDMSYSLNVTNELSTKTNRDEDLMNYMSFVKGIKNANPANFINNIVWSSEYKSNKTVMNKKTGDVQERETTVRISPIYTRQMIDSKNNIDNIDYNETAPLRFINRF